MKSSPALSLDAPLLDVTAGHFRGRAVHLVEPFETYALVRLDGETVVMPTANLRPRRFWRRLLFLLLGLRPLFAACAPLPREKLSPERAAAESRPEKLAPQISTPEPTVKAPTPSAPCKCCCDVTPQKVTFEVFPAPPAWMPKSHKVTFKSLGQCTECHVHAATNQKLYLALLNAQRRLNSALTPSRN